MSSAPKLDRAVAAAEDVFTRYGYARTTMRDIAARAGMSRPALYLLFPDKEGVFARVVEAMDDRKHAELADLIAGTGTAADKLRQACLSWALHGVELAAAHPDAADLFDLRFPAVERVYARFEALVAGLIADTGGSPRPAADVAELARVLVHGMRGLREAAIDADDMRRLVTVLVDTFTR